MEDLRLLGDDRQAVRHTQLLPLHRIDAGFRRPWTNSLRQGSETIHLRIRRLLDHGIELKVNNVISLESACNACGSIMLRSAKVFPFR